MKKIFSIILFLALSMVVCAQQTYQAIAYQLFDQPVEQQVKTNNIHGDNSGALRGKSKPQAIDTISKKSHRANKQKGFTNISEFDFGIGKVTVNGFGNANQMSFGLQTINGYQFSRYFSIGLGLGIVKYNGYTIPYGTRMIFYKMNEFMIPLFADIRFNFLKGSITPFLSLSAGYSFSLSTKYGNHGGVFLNPSLGLKFFISTKTAFHFGVGYRYHSNTFETNVYENHVHEMRTLKETVNLLSLKIGMIF